MKNSVDRASAYLSDQLAVVHAAVASNETAIDGHEAQIEELEEQIVAIRANIEAKKLLIADYLEQARRLNLAKEQLQV